MSNTVGIRFSRSGDLAYFDAAELDPQPGQWVVADSGDGPAVGLVAAAPAQIIHSSFPAPLPPILRMATADDFQDSPSMPGQGAALLDMQVETGDA